MDYLGLVEGEGIFPAATIIQIYRHIEPGCLSLYFVWYGYVVRCAWGIWYTKFLFLCLGFICLWLVQRLEWKHGTAGKNLHLRLLPISPPSLCLSASSTHTFVHIYPPRNYPHHQIGLWLAIIQVDNELQYTLYRLPQTQAHTPTPPHLWYQLHTHNIAQTPRQLQPAPSVKIRHSHRELTSQPSPNDGSWRYLSRTLLYVMNPAGFCHWSWNLMRDVIITFVMALWRFERGFRVWGVSFLTR